MKKLTPEEYVLQYACAWRVTKNALKGVSPEERPATQADHRINERNLLQSVEVYVKEKPFFWENKNDQQS